MDHGGQIEREGRVMSHIQVGGPDLCDNLPNPQALSAQTQNLNETNTLTNPQSLLPSQNVDEGKHALIHDVPLGSSGKEGNTGRGGEEDEEEDTDELMKEAEEEEESEGSSCPIRCQSPGTPMTDSSYSETGSLLETPYPFSPGTSPGPASPVIPAVSPVTAYPISQVDQSQNGVRVDSDSSNTESLAESGTGTVPVAPVCTTDSTTPAQTPDIRLDSPAGPAFTTVENTNSTAGLHTSTTDPSFNHRPSIPVSTTPGSATAGSLTFTAGLTSTGTDSTPTTGPLTLSWEHIITSTPVSTPFSVPTCATGPIPSPALLESLEQLAERGDEPLLPQYLHQIAEAFVLQEDYQQALWCIQLERLYHQRVLENLNSLQDQWESRCRMTSSNLAAQHLDTLKRICQTHNRPSAKDAVYGSQNLLSPKAEVSSALSPCTSAHQSDGGMEQRARDSSHSPSSCPVRPSMNLSSRHDSPEISEQDRGDPDRESQGSDCSDREGGVTGGGVGCTTAVTGNEQHPSVTGGMDQSKPAEQQGGDLGLAQEKEAKREEEEGEVEEAAEALEMEDEGEEEEEEKRRERDSGLCQEDLPVETLISGAEVEEHLHQEDRADKRLHDETQPSEKTYLELETHLPPETCMRHQAQTEEGIEEEEEEEEYEVEQAQLIREAAVLDDMAKLITVEEMSPSSGLVSILKKRKVCVDDVSVSATSEPQPDKPSAKRRVRFKVPDDGYEHDVGGGDSCLLLFLLCMVTVVISVGGTALYCALGDAHSSVCQDFTRNADFYMGQLQRGIAHIQHLFTTGS